jgi:hypothetical protein
MRMFGVSEAFDSGGQALGAAIVPLLVLVFDVRWAIVIAGAFLPLTFLAMRRAFGDIDDRAVIPQPIIDALSDSPVFDGLSADAVEYLARTSTAMSIGPAEQLMAQGDVNADAAWLILAGAVDVVIDGEAVARLHHPDLVGEIALIHSAPRNASVVAHTACELLRIDHETFLDVVVGGRSGGDHVRVLAARRINENHKRWRSQ